MFIRSTAIAWLNVLWLLSFIFFSVVVLLLSSMLLVCCCCQSYTQCWCTQNVIFTFGVCIFVYAVCSFSFSADMIRLGCMLSLAILAEIPSRSHDSFGKSMLKSLRKMPVNAIWGCKQMYMRACDQHRSVFINRLDNLNECFDGDAWTKSMGREARKWFFEICYVFDTLAI